LAFRLINKCIGWVAGLWACEFYICDLPSLWHLIQEAFRITASFKIEGDVLVDLYSIKRPSCEFSLRIVAPQVLCCCPLFLRVFHFPLAAARQECARKKAA